MTDIKQIWTTQPVEENFMISLADIRARATRFEARSRNRNLLLYGYSALTIAVAGALFVSGQHALPRAPLVLLILAHVFVLWQVVRRRARPLPDAAGAQPALDFHRGELERQHRTLSKAWLWYIAPLVAPVILQVALVAPHVPHKQMLIVLIPLGVTFWTCVWLFFSRGAARIETQLAELAALRAE